jgi:CheY-like chemotaxis protein
MRTILIADDEEGIRALIATTLESPDCRLLEAEDGATALEAAHRAAPPVEVLALTAARSTAAHAG